MNRWTQFLEHGGCQPVNSRRLVGNVAVIGGILAAIAVPILTEVIATKGMIIMGIGIFVAVAGLVDRLGLGDRVCNRRRDDDSDEDTDSDVEVIDVDEAEREIIFKQVSQFLEDGYYNPAELCSTEAKDKDEQDEKYGFDGGRASRFGLRNKRDRMREQIDETNPVNIEFHGEQMIEWWRLCRILEYKRIDLLDELKPKLLRTFTTIVGLKFPGQN